MVDNMINISQNVGVNRARFL